MTTQKQAGIPTVCADCTAPLHAHNLTGSCAACKLIARNKRLAPAYDDGGRVSLAEALHNVATILGAHPLSDCYAGPCQCGKARARTDTGRCEWCTARGWQR
jgi:hypothetical protein